MTLSSLCKIGVHDWQPTTSALYLKCHRTHCGAVKRTDDKTIVVETATKEKEQAKCPEQTTFME
jgi:hypothetical protein